MTPLAVMPSAVQLAELRLAVILLVAAVAVDGVAGEPIYDIGELTLHFLAGRLLTAMRLKQNSETFLAGLAVFVF